MNNPARILACATLLAAALCASPASAQELQRYKLAASLPALETVHYQVVDLHTPAAPVNTVDLQVISEERLLDRPDTFVRTMLNGKLEREGEEADRRLVDKYFGSSQMAIKEFEIRLTREYPTDSRYMNIGAMQGGLLGVLVGAAMDGMRNRSNARQMMLVRVLMQVGDKTVEGRGISTYTDETVQTALMNRADAAISDLAFQLRAQARDLETAANAPAQPATPTDTQAPALTQVGALLPEATQGGAPSVPLGAAEPSAAELLMAPVR